MLTRCRRWLFKLKSLFLAKLIKNCLYLLFKTCRLRFVGLEQFQHLVQQEKCLLMLWHNRLAITPFILSHYTPFIQYAALVSASRDGEILSTIIHSYQNGHTIRVPHLARYQALREIIRHVKEKKYVVIITPDGPRGPRYEVKPGLAIAAIETHAHVVALNWKAEKYWELKTWDRLRLPKPFTTLHVTFASPIRLDPSSSLEEAQAILKKHLPQD